jgi:hypothetical protein
MGSIPKPTAVVGQDLSYSPADFAGPRNSPAFTVECSAGSLLPLVSIESKHGVDEPGYVPPEDAGASVPVPLEDFLAVQRRATKRQRLGKLLVIDIDGRRLLSEERSYPLIGAKASVETAGNIERRITATRLLLTGPLALGLRKKTDSRALYLIIEGPGWSLPLKLNPQTEAQARAFAAEINAIAATSSSSNAAADPLSLLAKLAELRDQGIITADEFEAKKAELLGRL